MSRKRDQVVYIERGWQPVFIGFCPSKRAWKREMKRLNVPKGDRPYPQSAGCMSSFERDGKIICIVTIREGAEHELSLTELSGLLIHECVHVWQTIREVIGETRPGDEMEAYAVQCITQTIMALFHETRGLPRMKTIRAPHMEKIPPA